MIYLNNTVILSQFWVCIKSVKAQKIHILSLFDSCGKISQHVSSHWTKFESSSLNQMIPINLFWTFHKLTWESYSNDYISVWNSVNDRILIRCHGVYAALFNRDLRINTREMICYELLQELFKILSVCFVSIIWISVRSFMQTNLNVNLFVSSINKLPSPLLGLHTHKEAVPKHCHQSCPHRWKCEV